MPPAARRAVLALLPLAACAAPEPEAARQVAVRNLAPTELAARLPTDAAGFQRGQALPLARGEAGREVAYATRGRIAAGATVELYRPEGGPVPEGPDSPAAAEAFEQLLRDALRPQPHRRLRESARLVLPAAGPPALRCAETEGSYGRERVQGLLCAGGIGGGLLRLRVTMPARHAPAADPRAFATAIVAALRGP